MAGKLKRTTKEAAEYFSEQGCELLDKYNGAQVKMKYRCSCGEIGNTSWNNFSNGKRCGCCSKFRNRYTLDDVKEMFSERGCELLSQEYKGNKEPLIYKCKCGRESKICLVAFKYQNQLCKECGREKNMGPNHHGWRSNRTKKREDDLFRKKCYSALRTSLKAVGKEKVGHTSDMLGYGPKELQEHITQHPNWAKVKDISWHLDHIFPINAFLEHNITDVSLINHLSNLQPLSQSKNNQKHAKYNRKEFKKWLKSVR